MNISDSLREPKAVFFCPDQNLDTLGPLVLHRRAVHSRAMLGMEAAASTHSCR